ncbi:MAG: AraC family transcriptional regulator [Sphingomicrobium sp.]
MSYGSLTPTDQGQERLRAEKLVMQDSVSEAAPTTRSAALTNYVQVSRFLGLDPYQELRQARIATHILDDPDNRIPAISVVNLFEASAEASNCMSFGLYMAECRDFASLGPISVLLNYLPTMRDIIKGFIEYRILISDILNIVLEDDGANAEIHWELGAGFAKRQIVENAVGVSYKIFTSAMAGRWQPELVHFRHSAPADMRHHRNFFQCDLEFDSSFDGWSCPSEWLDAHNPNADPALARNAAKLMELLPNSRKRSLAESTKLAVSLLIPHGDITIEKVADNLALHPRNLQRQLEDEGQTFAGILNSTKRELSIRYLTSSRNSITDIALLLGYSGTSPFTRWFTREFGKSPRQWQSSATTGMTV